MELWVGNLHVISNKFCDYWDLELQCSTETQRRATGTDFQGLLLVDANFLLLSSQFTQNDINATNDQH